MSQENDRTEPANIRLRLEVFGTADAPSPGRWWRLVDSFKREGSLYILARERPLRTGVAALTSREQEIVGFLSRGLTTKEAAYELRISDATVRVLVGRAAAKLGTHGRSELLSHPEVQRLRGEG